MLMIGGCACLVVRPFRLSLPNTFLSDVEWFFGVCLGCCDLECFGYVLVAPWIGRYLPSGWVDRHSVLGFEYDLDCGCTLSV